MEHKQSPPPSQQQENEPLPQPQIQQQQQNQQQRLFTADLPPFHQTKEEVLVEMDAVEREWLRLERHSHMRTVGMALDTAKVVFEEKIEPLFTQLGRTEAPYECRLYGFAAGVAPPPDAPQEQEQEGNDNNNNNQQQQLQQEASTTGADDEDEDEEEEAGSDLIRRAGYRSNKGNLQNTNNDQVGLGTGIGSESAICLGQQSAETPPSAGAATSTGINNNNNNQSSNQRQKETANQQQQKKVKHNFYKMSRVQQQVLCDNAMKGLQALLMLFSRRQFESALDILSGADLKKRTNSRGIEDPFWHVPITVVTCSEKQLSAYVVHRHSIVGASGTNCSCMDFKNGVLLQQKNPFCKHILALQLAYGFKVPECPTLNPERKNMWFFDEGHLIFQKARLQELQYLMNQYREQEEAAGVAGQEQQEDRTAENNSNNNNNNNNPSPRRIANETNNNKDEDEDEDDENQQPLFAVGEREAAAAAAAAQREAFERERQQQHQQEQSNVNNNLNTHRRKQQLATDNWCYACSKGNVVKWVEEPERIVCDVLAGQDYDEDWKKKEERLLQELQQQQQQATQQTTQQQQQQQQQQAFGRRGGGNLSRGRRR